MLFSLSFANVYHNIRGQMYCGEMKRPPLLRRVCINQVLILARCMLATETTYILLMPLYIYWSCIYHLIHDICCTHYACNWNFWHETILSSWLRGTVAFFGLQYLNNINPTITLEGQGIERDINTLASIILGDKEAQRAQRYTGKTASLWNAHSVIKLAPWCSYMHVMLWLQCWPHLVSVILCGL